VELGDLSGSRIEGTTLRVYRFIFAQRRPVGIRDIQRAINLASPSTAHYHVQKLLGMGLVQVRDNGYVVDRVFLENFVKIKGTIFPIEVPLVAFFVIILTILLTLARPSTLTSSYLLGVMACCVGFVASLLTTIRDARSFP
jgi:hypothetical protein